MATIDNVRSYGSAKVHRFARTSVNGDNRTVIVTVCGKQMVNWVDLDPHWAQQGLSVKGARLEWDQCACAPGR